MFPDSRKKIEDPVGNPMQTQGEHTKLTRTVSDPNSGSNWGSWHWEEVSTAPLCHPLTGFIVVY